MENMGRISVITLLKGLNPATLKGFKVGTMKHGATVNIMIWAMNGIGIE